MSFWLQGIPIIPFNSAWCDSIFACTDVVLLGLDDLKSYLNSFIFFVLEIVVANKTRMYCNANTVTVGSVGFGSIDISSKDFGVCFFNVFCRDNYFNLKLIEDLLFS